MQSLTEMQIEQKLCVNNAKTTKLTLSIWMLSVYIDLYAKALCGEATFQPYKRTEDRRSRRLKDKEQL